MLGAGRIEGVMETRVHASCIAVEGKGVLLAGPSGVGKSDLALRLMDAGAELVADDWTLVREEGDALMASAPPSIAGLIEVRHIGILRVPCRPNVRIALYIDLLPPQALPPDRCPEEERIFLLDRPVRRLRLLGLESSTPAKIRAALAFPVVT